MYSQIVVYEKMIDIFFTTLNFTTRLKIGY